MATPSASIVESLIGAIPIEVGAALVARVGERATITAKSGSIEVGSVALTVEAMDDLIAQVLPPDQLESLQENGTVHFEFKPLVIGGDFAVLAASTPGDRWLEIRRRTTAVAAATAAAPAVVSTPAVIPAAAFAVEAEVVTPVPTAAASAGPTAVTDGTDVAQLLSRFNTSTQAEPTSWEPPAAAPVAPLFRPAESFLAAESPVDADFDLNLVGKVPLKESLPAPAPVAQRASTNDDLSIPSILDFPAAKSDFDLDDLSLPDTLPEPAVESFATEALSESTDFDHITSSEPKARGMGKLRFSTSTTESQPRRSIVVIASVVLGLVVLGAGGWYAAQYYLSAPSVVAAPPAAAPRKTVQSNAVASNIPTNTPKAAAAKPNANVATQKPQADAPAPTPVPPQVVARAKADTPAPKPTITRPASQPSTPVATQDAAPAAAVAREGFAIQVAAVLERSEADQIVARLVKQGYPGYAIRGQGSAAAYFRVRVGAFKDRQTAEDIAARLARSEGIKPWIVKETP
jgi:cell division septation protein DedD